MPILLLLIFIVVIFSISAILVHMSAYPSYKITYNALVTEEYVWDGKDYGLICFSKPSSTRKYSLFADEIIFFRDDNKGSIKLIGGEYIFSYLPTYLDPYTWYWKRKFDKWFEENKSKFTNKK